MDDLVTVIDAALVRAQPWYLRRRFANNTESGSLRSDAP